MKKYTRLILATLSGILLALPWYGNFSGLIASIALVPLLIIEDNFFKKKSSDNNSLYGYTVLTFFIWNIIATYWLKNSNLVAAGIVICSNTLAMSLIFGLFHVTKKTFAHKIGFISLIVYWLSFEYIFLHAHLTWPWLNLGNAFSGDIKLIQWYEYTGTLGGSLWILTLNITFFKAIKLYFQYKNIKVLTSNIFIFVLVLVIPILISRNIYKTRQETGEDVTIAIIQPNFDPYSEKYDIPQDQQLERILHLSDSIANEKTEYVIAPETSISNPIWESNLDTDSSILRIKKFVHNHRNLNFIIGANTLKKVKENELSPCSKYNKEENYYYNAYNAALQIDTTNQIPIYYKSKLVSGVETMPFLQFFGFLDKIFFDFGGITGSICSQKDRGVFNHAKKDISIAPVICYESAFGEHVSDYMKQGANLIFLLTNDGWWGESPGYKQHLRLSQIRAIETRRSIARCANTGVSAFINQRGETLKQTKGWVEDAIQDSLTVNHHQTFYVRYGDYIGRISGFLAIFMFLYTFVKNLMSKSIKNNIKLRKP